MRAMQFIGAICHNEPRSLAKSEANAAACKKGRTSKR
jgi:hypothetical protein